MSVFNTQLLATARHAIQKNAAIQKQAFVDAAAASGGGGDPAAAAGGADPMAGAMPPMPGMAPEDPAAAAGGGGGAPPSDPRIDQMMSMIQQLMSQGGGGGGAMGGVEPIKPKIDVNVEIMQMKKMIARLCDAMGVQIPAAEMTATTQDLTQMGMQSQSAGTGAPPTSAIAPPSPIQPAMPAAAGGGGGEKKSSDRGQAVPRINTMRDLGDAASAMASVLRLQLQT